MFSAFINGCDEDCVKLLPSDGVDRDSGGELGRGARAGSDRDKMSLPARARRPDSPCQSRSTPADGNQLVH